MEFKSMSAAEYRALDDAAFEQRRSAVVAELENADSVVEMSVLDAEVECIEAEVERRNKAVALRSAKIAAVASGEGALKANTPAPKVETVRNEDPFDSEAYTRAYAENIVFGTPMPAGIIERGAIPSYVKPSVAEQFRANQFTTTDDTPTFVPTTLYNKIIEKLDEYGEVYPKATKISVQGGLDIPIWDFLPTASWVTEKKTSDDQKATDASTISFKYYMLECKVAQSFLQNLVSLSMFTNKFPDAVAQAMVMALEQAMFNGTGTGQPTGILTDTRVTDKVEVKAADLASWKGISTLLSGITRPYRAKGEFYMAQDTWDAYIDGMVDADGQPIARVTYGINGEEVYRLRGKAVNIVPDDILPAFDDAKGKGFMLFGNLSNYIFNNQMGMRSVRWIDEDNNVIKQKMQIVTDGKMADVNGLRVFTAPSA